MVAGGTPGAQTLGLLQTQVQKAAAVHLSTCRTIGTNGNECRSSIPPHPPAATGTPGAQTLGLLQTQVQKAAAVHLSTWLVGLLACLFACEKLEEHVL